MSSSDKRNRGEVINKTSANLDSFKTLMQDLKDGSEEAAWKITEQYSGHIQRAVRKRLPREIRSKVDSVDIVNSIWGSFLLKRTKFLSIDEPAQLVALLTKIVANRVIDEHRKYTVCASRDIRSEAGSYDEKSLQQDCANHIIAGNGALGGREDSPSQIAISREKWLALKSSLSQRDQQIVSLRISGLNYKQIAEQMEDVSARSARRVLADVTKALLQ